MLSDAYVTEVHFLMISNSVRLVMNISFWSANASATYNSFLRSCSSQLAFSCFMLLCRSILGWSSSLVLLKCTGSLLIFPVYSTMPVSAGWLSIIPMWSFCFCGSPKEGVLVQWQWRYFWERQSAYMRNCQPKFCEGHWTGRRRPSQLETVGELTYIL